MTKLCLLCGAVKADDELILCDLCMNYFDEIQAQTLQAQLNAIKRGMSEND
jgi:uncharacterized membrane protein YvbJ